MKKFYKLLLYLVLISFSLTTLLPFIYMISTALTPSTYYLPFPPILIPKSFYLGNFINALQSNNFGRYFLNSAYVAVTSTFFAILISTWTAYAFARFEFRCKEFLFKVFLFSMMVPGLLNIVPQFLLINSLGLVDTYTGLTFLYIGLGTAGNTFFLRGFFESIPKELEESMIIDGGNRWTVYFRLILPLSKPAIATLSIFTFTNFWDEFYGALTIIKTAAKRTLPIAIQLFRGNHASDWGLIFAASLIAVGPTILIFIIFQKRFIHSNAISGSLKG